MKNKIMVLKLISGEGVISEITTDCEFHYECKNPAQIAMQENSEGKIGMMIMAMLPYIEGVITINKNAIAAYGTPAIDLADEYQSRFTETPLIQVPSSKIIL